MLLFYSVFIFLFVFSYEKRIYLPSVGLRQKLVESRHFSTYT